MVLLHTRHRLQPCIETGHFVPGTSDTMMVQSTFSIRLVALRTRHFELHSLKEVRCEMVVVLEQLVVLLMLAYQTRSLDSCYLVVVFEQFREQVAFHHSTVFFPGE